MTFALRGVNRGVNKKENLQPIEIQSVGDLLGDPYRIQTCNLLIRSQILYSVELTGHTVCFSDPYRIQTCNLLIRSQILYSVELMGQSQPLFCELRCKGMEFFSNTKQKRSFFMSDSKILLYFYIIFLFLPYIHKNETTIILHNVFVCDVEFVGTV